MKLLSPFGPFIGKFKLEKEIVDILNSYADKTLKSEEALRKNNLASHLEGRVTSEYSVPISVLENCFDFFANCALEYLRGIAKERPDAGWSHQYLISLQSAWINSMFAGDCNPVHHHDGSCQLVGTAFLKVPDFSEEHKKETDAGKKRQVAGCLEVFHGQPSLLSPSQYLINPEVGDFYMFPASTYHTVYAFKSDGERRSFAINLSTRQIQKQKKQD